MEFGVCLPNFTFGAEPTKANILEVAQTAESLSYDSVWTSDHVLVTKDKPRYGTIFEALTTLAYVAGATKKVRLGTSVLVVPQRDAILVAKQVATIDALSEGRVILGIGVGWMDDEYANLGAQFNNRGRRMDEALKMMKVLWVEDDPQFEGEFYNFTSAIFGPKPSQTGGPPILVGGASDAAINRIASLGDGWHADDSSLEELEEVTTRLRSMSDESGRPPAQISLRRTVDLRPVAADMGLLDKPSKDSGIKTGDRWPGSSTGALTGSLEDITAYIDQAVSLGVSHLIYQFEASTQEECLIQMDLAAREVNKRYS